MKTTKKKFLSYACMGISISLLFTACKKDDSDKKDNSKDQSTAVSLTAASSLSQSLYDDVFTQINVEAENNNIANKPNGETDVQGCATVSISPADLTTFPKTLTIDYGAGCTIGAITRKGKLIATVSGRLRTPGTTVSVSFDNYFVNGYKLEGIFNVTNNTSNNIPSFTTQTINGKLTYPAGAAYYTHSGSHTYTQVGGASTPTFLDDSWSVTGNGTTTSSANESLTVTIKTPLVKNIECGSVVSGTEDFQYNNVKGSLDFGNGACDRKATLTIGAYSSIIDF